MTPPNMNQVLGLRKIFDDKEYPANTKYEAKVGNQSITLTWNETRWLRRILKNATSGNLRPEEIKKVEDA